MRLFIFFYLFLAPGLADVFHDAGLESDDAVDLEHEAKKWWVVEDKDGTQHFDVEAMCSRKVRISARDGSPVNELLGHGFDKITGQVKGRIREAGHDSSDPVYEVVMAPMWNAITPEMLGDLGDLSPEFEKTMELIKKAAMKRCKNKIASYAADSRYKIEIV